MTSLAFYVRPDCMFFRGGLTGLMVIRDAIQIIDNTDSISNGGLFKKVILPFYESGSQQQYVAARQYTIDAMGQRKKVTVVNRLRCHTLHYPDIYKHPYTLGLKFLCMYTYTHEVVSFTHVIKSLKHIRTQTCQHIRTLGPSGAYMRH